LNFRTADGVYTYMQRRNRMKTPGLVLVLLMATGFAVAAAPAPTGTAPAPTPTATAPTPTSAAPTGTTPAAAGPAAAPAAAEKGEVVNGLRIDLEAAVRPDGQPTIKITIINAGDKPLDLLDRPPLFLEVQGADGNWRSFEHPGWKTKVLGKAHRFEKGQSDSETEPVSAFTTLAPGTYKVRVTLAIEATLLAGYTEKNLWSGVVRTNAVTITVPDK
jgi:hypothetical protein